MTTIKVINNEEYKRDIAEEVGSLMCSSKYYDCKHYVDKPQMRKNLKREGIDIPVGARIMHIIVQTKEHPDFKNILNTKIPYKTSVCSNSDIVGAYRKHYPEMNFTMWATEFPSGDAILVYNI